MTCRVGLFDLRGSYMMQLRRKLVKSRIIRALVTYITRRLSESNHWPFHLSKRPVHSSTDSRPGRKMVLFTMITRLRDYMPLAASMQNDEEAERSLIEYQQQAKLLLRKLNSQSPMRCTIESGAYVFHYLIESDVVYLTLCDKNFSKRLAYSYLEDLAQEFQSLYAKKIQTATRPYFFIEFDTYIQKARKSILDSRSRRNLSALNTELQDVQRIMVQNIDDVINRGVVLSELDHKAQNLTILSQKYKKDATYLNLRSGYAKAAAGFIVFFVVVLYFWVL